jgi:predicted nuclease of predicted toxin-antitoxin system
MRILLDESLPRGLAALIVGHSVSTVRVEGWAGVKNGKLLALAATRFDVFLTADRNLEFQQNLATLPISVVVLICSRTRLENMAHLVPELMGRLQKLPPKAVTRVGT